MCNVVINSRYKKYCLHSFSFFSLQELKLHENSITTVPRSALQNLQSLKSLYLQSNYILDIGLLSFPNISNLQFLNLSSNDILTVHDGAFSPLQQLKTLILSNNKIHALSPGFLDGVANIEYLDLSQNLLEELSINQPLDRSLKKLILYANKIRSLSKVPLNLFHSLEYLDIRRNRIFEIAPNIFSSMQNLKELHLDINTVRKITNEMFIGLEGLSDLTLNDNRILAFPTEPLNLFQNLRRLSLDYNRIAAISREILAPVRKNKELSLAFNLISEIPDETFMEFENLELLNLHGNKISDLSGKKTHGLEQSLLYLDIGYNEITDLPQFEFQNLLILSMAKNKISKINTSTLKSLTKLIYLNVSYNMISEFSYDLLTGLKSMERLDFQQNMLTYIPVGTFRNLSLVELNLKNNHLGVIKENAFETLMQMKYLDLSFNKIEQIAENAFNNVPNIEILNLMGNKLSAFTGNEFSFETKLKQLILSQNEISSLNSKSFMLHPLIVQLDLSFNELTYFPHETISNLRFIKEINLAGNKLHSVGHNYFSNMHYLRKIDLQNNLITDISESAFSNSTSLRLILLQKNQISSLSENTFVSLNRLELDVSNNNLSSLPGNIFSRIKGLKLESINLSGNNLRDFPNEALKKQYSFLEIVNVSYNKIRNLPPKADILVNVKELDLSYNPLSLDVFDEFFSDPKSVRTLHIEGVGIPQLPVIEFPFLMHLNIKGNKIAEISSNVFYKTNMLVKLDISENAIPNLNVNLLPAISKLSYLRELDLSGNPIRYITRNDFSRFSHLRNLKINNLKELTSMNCESLQSLPRLCKLQIHGYKSLQQFNVKQCLQNITGLELLSVEIKDMYLKDQLQAIYSPKLETLAISGEQLRTISSSAFAGMLSSAIKIKMSYTSVDTFSDKIFLPLPLSSKIEFNIPFNKIHRLTQDVLTALDNKQVDIVIYGLNLNPVKCDCHMNTLWTWLQDKMKVSVNQHPGIKALSELMCFEPQVLQGQRIRDLKLSDLVCDRFSSSTTLNPTIETSSSIYSVSSTEVTASKEISTHRDHPYIIFEAPVTKKPSIPLSHVPANGSRSTLTKVDTMIIGIVAGVVAFVCILIIIICIIRLRRAHPLYTAGPLAGPLAFRAQGKCTCLKPPPNSCTCYPMYSVPYASSGRPSLLPGPQHKMLPPSLPPPSGFLNSAGQSGRLRNTPYYVTYPDSDNENK